MSRSANFNTDERMLLFLVAAIFAVLGVEAYLAHFPRLQSPGPAWMPVVFSAGACLVTTGLAFARSRWWVMVGEVTLWLSIGMGVGGALMHLASPTLTAFSINLGWLGYPPVLAPLSYVLPGGVGLAILRSRRAGECSPQSPSLSDR